MVYVCYDVTFAWENPTALNAVTKKFKGNVAAWSWPSSRYLAALWLKFVSKEVFCTQQSRYTLPPPTARRCTFADDLSRMFFANFPSVHSNDLPAAHSSTALAVAPSKHRELQCPTFSPWFAAFETKAIAVGNISKAIPLQVWTGPECSKRLRLPDFKTIGTWRW